MEIVKQERAIGPYTQFFPVYAVMDFYPQRPSMSSSTLATSRKEHSDLLLQWLFPDSLDYSYTNSSNTETD